MPVDNGGEYTGQSIVVKLVNRDDIKMSCEATSDVVTTPSGWTHGGNKQLEIFDKECQTTEISRVASNEKEADFIRRHVGVKGLCEGWL
jgi:hypothetical protein